MIHLIPLYPKLQRCWGGKESTNYLRKKVTNLDPWIHTHKVSIPQQTWKLHCQNTSYMVKDTLFLVVSSYELDRWLVFLKTSALFRRTFKINNFHSPQKACLWLKNVSVVHVEKIQIFQVNIWENKIIHTHDLNSFYYSICPIYFTFFLISLIIENSSLKMNTCRTMDSNINHRTCNLMFLLTKLCSQKLSYFTFVSTKNVS
jgi:hypothetical protein